MSARDSEAVARHPAAQWQPNRERLLAALEAKEEADDAEAEDDVIEETQPLPWAPQAPVAQSDRATAS